MKNKIGLFFLMIALITSCTSDELVLNNQAVDSDTNNPGMYKAAGDQVYDLLGYGVDITGEYLAPLSNKQQVINIVKLKLEKPDAVGAGSYEDKNGIIKYGRDYNTLTDNLDVKVSGTVSKGVYSGTVKQDVICNNTISSTCAYALVEERIIKRNVSVVGTYEMLSQYLTDGFKENIIAMTPEQIINAYGTHVFTNIYLGAKFQFIYKSEIHDSNKEQTLISGVSATAKSAFGISINADVTTSTSLISNNKEISVRYKTIGGNAAFAVVGNLDIQNPDNITTEINTWKASIGNNLAMIDVQDNSMIPIYEFVTDASKKAALKSAVDNYIARNALTQVLPLYRYYNKDHTGHFYTTDYTELGNATQTNSWVLEKIQGYVLPTNSTATNTVGLKRYYNSSSHDHFYTIGVSESTNWKFEWIECNVFKFAEPGTVPLHRYYASKQRLHFYTTDYRELGSGNSKYRYEGIECYIIPNNRL